MLMFNHKKRKDKIDHQRNKQVNDINKNHQ